MSVAAARPTVGDSDTCGASIQSENIAHNVAAAGTIQEWLRTGRARMPMWAQAGDQTRESRATGHRDVQWSGCDPARCSIAYSA